MDSAIRPICGLGGVARRDRSRLRRRRARDHHRWAGHDRGARHHGRSGYHGGTRYHRGAGHDHGTAGELPKTIKVGAVIPITGKYSGLGEQVKNGYELAVADINAAGGVDVGGTKVPIELSILDDESDPTKTVQQLETHNSNGVVAYLGGAGSDLHAAAAGIAEKNKIAYLGIAFALYTGVIEQGFKYVFSPFPKSADHAKITFDMLDSFTPKPSKVVIFAREDRLGCGDDEAVD